MVNWNRLFGNSEIPDNSVQDRSPVSASADQQFMPRNKAVDESGQAGKGLPFTELGQFKVHEASVRLLDHQYCLDNYVVVLDAVDNQSGDPVTRHATPR